MDHGATQPLLFSTPAESEHLLKEVHVALDFFIFIFIFFDKCSIHQTATKKFSSIKCTTCFWKDSIKQTCYQVMRFLKKNKNKLIFCFLVLVYTNPDLLDVALHHYRQMEFRIYLKWKINLAGYTKPPLHTKTNVIMILTSSWHRMFITV